MKKVITILLLVTVVGFGVSTTAFAANTAVHGKMSGKTVVAGLCSLLLWPGLGQYLNDNETKKNLTHAVIGILPPFRLWSGWDALVARQGGRWDGKI